MIDCFVCFMVALSAFLHKIGCVLYLSVKKSISYCKNIKFIVFSNVFLFSFLPLCLCRLLHTPVDSFCHNVNYCRVFSVVNEIIFSMFC